ncbi:MAG: nuclear transport factor 2 family protein [Bacteroidota bacterium]
MHKIFIFISLSLFLLIACQPTPASETTQSASEIQATIDSLLDDWHRAAAEGNYEAYFGAMDSSSIFIGTDATENWSKQDFSDFAKPYFDKGRAWDFTPFDRNIYLSEVQNVVWFDELLRTWMGTCIGSGVFERIDGNWSMKHYVLSVKVPNESVQAVIAAKQVQDSLFLINAY